MNKISITLVGGVALCAAALLPFSASAWAYGPTGMEMSGYQAQAYLNSLNSSSLYTVPHPYYTSAGSQYASAGYSMPSYYGYGYQSMPMYGNNYATMPYYYMPSSYSYPQYTYSYPTYSYPMYNTSSYAYGYAYNSSPVYYFNNY